MHTINQDRNMTYRYWDFALILIGIILHRGRGAPTIDNAEPQTREKSTLSHHRGNLMCAPQQARVRICLLLLDKPPIKDLEFLPTSRAIPVPPCVIFNAFEILAALRRLFKGAWKDACNGWEHISLYFVVGFYVLSKIHHEISAF